MSQSLDSADTLDASKRDAAIDPSWKSSRWICLAISAVLLLKFAVFALFITPLWDSPDEPGHYSYVTDLGEGRYPVLGEAQINPGVLDSWLGPGTKPRSNWIAQHPPLSYMAAVPADTVGKLLGLSLDSRVRMTRLTSSIIGALAILGLMAFLITATGSPALGMAGAIFIAATPMFTQLSGAVTNDTLVACTAAWAAYWYARWTASGIFRHALICAFIVGLGCMTKVTMLVLAIPLFFALAYRLIKLGNTSAPGALMKRLALLWVAAFSLISVWIIHNYTVFHAFLPTARILRGYTEDATHIGFFHFMDQYPIWQTILWNFVALVGWMGTIPGKVMTGAADGLIVSYYASAILFCSVAGMLHAFRKIGRRDIEWPALVVAALATAWLCVTWAKIPYTTLTCAMLFLSVAWSGASNLSALWTSKEYPWLLLSASAFILFFSAVYYYKIWGFYNQISHVKGLHGRYFYVVLPFFVLLMLHPLRRGWLPKAALCASLVSLVIADGFFLHYAFEMYGKY